MYMYTMYPYSVRILMCTMFVDCLCILDMTSMYVYYRVFFTGGRGSRKVPYWGDGGSLPYQLKTCSFSSHLKKFSPVDSPHQIFIPCLPTKSQLSPLNNNFQVNPIKTALLAVVIPPFPFLF